MEKTFKEIDVNSIDFEDAATFKKTSRIDSKSIEVSQEDQEIVTIIDGIEETRNTAHAGDRIITGPQGERYVIEEEKFEKLYEQNPESPEEFRSKGDVQAIHLTEDVSFEAPWGEQMHIEAGGVLVKNGDDIYGIEEKAFAQTYGRSDKDGNVFASLDEPLIEQRAKATAIGETSHLHDLEERKSYENDKILEAELDMGVSFEKEEDHISL